MPAFKNLTGQVFGRWGVIGLSSIKKAGRIYWDCQCECGTIREVCGGHLTRGKTISCGCYSKENPSRIIHGATDSAEYRIWSLMKSRCNNPNNPEFPRYGARGITVCHEWLSSFEKFYADMGPRPSVSHSIERIDNALGYTPPNCRWATKKEQARNTRRNKYYEIDGEKLCLAEICERLGLNYGTVAWRLRNGRSLEEALR